MGRAIGTINLTPQWQGKVGIVYLDRNQVKLLPAVGAFIILALFALMFKYREEPAGGPKAPDQKAAVA